MKITRHTSSKYPDFPTSLYLIGRAQRFLKPLLVALGEAESWVLMSRIRQRPVERPIYVCGLARSGSTITLELLSQHPDVATHRFLDMAQPYLPYFWNRLVQRLPTKNKTAKERIHQDGIMVTRTSPEAVEEMLWCRFFSHLHDENCSNVLDDSTKNPDFERFYREHISKLLLARGKSRYASKANYNVTRLEYLIRMFPDARFLIMIRNPVSHLISWIKQDEHVYAAHTRDPRWWIASREIGHHEFGRESRFINVGDAELVQRMRALWNDGLRIEAFGQYWSSVYGFLNQCLSTNPLLRQAAMVVRYEDLYSEPTQTIDRILSHCELDAVAFESARTEYSKKLCPPAYYDAALEPEELRTIRAMTERTARQFGYENLDISGSLQARS